MKSREEIVQRIQLYDWEENILNLENMELYVFATIFNLFKEDLRSFNYKYDFEYIYNVTKCSKHNYKEALKSLVTKNLIVETEYNLYPDVTYQYKPNIPYLQEVLLNSSDFKYNEEFFVTEITLNEKCYVVTLEALFYKKYFIVNTRPNIIPIDISISKALDIKGVDLIIVSHMLDNIRFGNSYSINDTILTITGLSEQDFYEHMVFLCESRLVYIANDFMNRLTYHINTELYDILSYINYLNEEEKEA